MPLSLRVSNPPSWARLIFALQLPSLIRAIEMHKFAFSLSLWACVNVALIWRKRTVQAPGAEHMLVGDNMRCFAASIGCLIVKSLTDRALQGAWPQLVFAHICSLDALALLFPTQFSGHWAYINHLRSTSLTALLLQVPFLISGVIMIWLAQDGYLNTSAGKTWLIVNAIGVWLAMVNVLQHVTVAFFRYVYTSAEVADVELEPSTLTAVDSAVEKWLKAVKTIPKAGELSLDEIRDLPLPEKQKRGSTRRRG